MAFEFIREELTEARYLRNPKDATGYSEYDIANTFFEHMLMLQQMRYENPEAAAAYAKKTMQYQNFSNVRTGATDLHNLGAILANQSKFADKLTSTGNVSLDELKFKRYLRDVASGKVNKAQDRQLFMTMQRNLGIRNSLLKNARRVAQDYGSATNQERKAVAQRMVNTTRQDQKFRSDIFRPYAATAASQGLISAPRGNNIGKAAAKTLAKAGVAGVAGYAFGRKFL
tara:strand:+ start:645 stop:1328 length:684 start_codon:yes stop_codon:yes gene_type:complete